MKNDYQGKFYIAIHVYSVLTIVNSVSHNMHSCVVTFKRVICKKSTKEFSYMALPYVIVRTE